MKLQIKSVKGTGKFMVELLDHENKKQRLFLIEPSFLKYDIPPFHAIGSKKIKECVFNGSEEATSAINRYKRLRKQQKPLMLEIENIVEDSFPIVEID